MTRPIVLDYRGTRVNANVDPETNEVTFRDKPVTGKMWLTVPGRRYVEIFRRNGRYYLEAAA